MNKRTNLESLNVVVLESLREVDIPRNIRGIRTALSEHDHLIVDISNATWADPIAVGMLAVVFANSPSDVTLLISPQTSSEHRRFLKYLSYAGFVPALSQHCTWCDSEKKLILPDELTNLIGAFTEVLIYENSNCIAAKLEKTDNLADDNLDYFVNQCVQEFKDSFSFELDKKAENKLDLSLSRVRQLIFELVENVVNHAYGRDLGHLFLFARTRRGPPKSAKDRKIWYSHRSLEEKNCYQVGQWLDYNIVENAHWIELFVCDGGDGLLSKLSDWHVEQNTSFSQLLDEARDNTTGPLKVLASSIFSGGYSRTKPAERKTATTGLQLTYETLMSSEDHREASKSFIRLLTGGEILAGQIPIGNVTPDGAGAVTGYQIFPIKFGTAYHIAFEISDSELKLPDTFKEPGKYQRIELENLLWSDALPRAPVNISFDQRHLKIRDSATSLFRRPQSELMKAKLEKINNQKNACILWLPSESTTKEDLHRWLMFCISRRVSKLTIADVPHHRAAFYEFLLSKEKIKWQADKGDDTYSMSVSLVTRGWSKAAFRSRIEDNNFISFEYLPPFDNKLTYDEINLSDLAADLRDSDSEKLWYPNQSEAITKAYIGEPVRWRPIEDDSLVVFGYLDITRVLSQITVRKTVKAAVERLLAYSKLYGEYAILIADEVLDWLSTDFTEVMTPEEFLYIISHGSETIHDGVVVLNSVVVTGRTNHKLKQLLSKNFPELEIYSATLFSHINFKENHCDEYLKYLSIFNWIEHKTPAFDERDAKYEKIKGSPYVALEGHKKYKITRSSGGRLEGQSPAEMYARFSRGNLKLGHWHYGSNHELLAVNLRRCINLEPTVTSWLSSQLSNINVQGELNLLVYIEHSTTVHLMSNLEQRNESVLANFSILPLHKTGIGNNLNIFFSPLELDEINRRIVSSKIPVNLVLLDDGSVSGKTIREAERQINLDLVKSITKLLLVDRANFIANDKDGESTRALWSWDVPSLGSEHNCRLCSAIDRAQIYAASSRYEYIERRVDSWLDAWRAVPVTTGSWDKNGVDSLPLDKPYPMKFGFNSENDALSIVQSNSSSLGAVMVEIASDTPMRDFPLRKVIEENKNLNKHFGPGTSIELLCTSLFLLDGSLSLTQRINYLSQLVDETWKVKQSTERTHLAGLVIFSVRDSLLEQVWHAVQRNIDSLGAPHEDCLVIAHYVCWRLNHLIPSSLNWLWTGNHSAVAIDAVETIKILITGQTAYREVCSSIMGLIGHAPGKSHIRSLPAYLESNNFSNLVLAGKQLNKLDSLLLQAESLTLTSTMLRDSWRDSFDSFHLAINQQEESIALQIAQNLIQENCLGNIRESLVLNSEKQLLDLLNKERKYFINSLASHRVEKEKQGYRFSGKWGGKRVSNIEIRKPAKLSPFPTILFPEKLRHWVRDAMFNSIHSLVLKEPLNDETVATLGYGVSQLWTYELSDDFLTIEVKNVVEDNHFELKSRGYQFFIETLGGSISRKFEYIGECTIHVITLTCPALHVSETKTQDSA